VAPVAPETRAFPQTGAGAGWSIAIAVEDHWTCALLCAELRERGLRARCVDHLAAALLLSEEEEREPTRLVVTEARVLQGADVPALQSLRAVDGRPAVLLIAPANSAVPDGPWDRLLRRPLTFGSLVECIGKATETAPRRDADGGLAGIVVRTGLPWPAVSCARCNTSRQCEAPRDARERERVRIAIAQFIVAHRTCAAPTS
jgi:hypothetical protein